MPALRPAGPDGAGPRIGVHLALGKGLRRAAERAGEIQARTVQVFVDNPTAWRRRSAPPRHLDAFRGRLAELDVQPVTVHAAYLVNLAGPDPAFRANSIDVLAADMAAASGYGASIVNVHTGSHRDTSVEAGVERVAAAVSEVLRRSWREARSRREGRSRRDDRSRGLGPQPAEPILALENSAGGGSAVGATIEELAAIAERAAAMGVAERRLGFCLDVAHAWGAGVGMDDPDAIEAWLDRFDRELGLDRLVMIHLNDSRSERGSRTDRHEHVGAGRIGPLGLAHLLRQPRLRDKPFILETPGMDEGYDRINLERCRMLLAGEPLPPLPESAFQTGRRTTASAPADDDVDARAAPGRTEPPPSGDEVRSKRRRRS